jgi:iron complex transport system ATP-binding protein
VTAAAVDTAPALACDGVSVALGGKQVLDGVSLEVPHGEWLNVVGPNGAGKTTLLRLLAGLVRPDAGTIAVEGHDARTLRRRDRALRIGLVPQAPLVPLGMTVAEYVLLGRTPHIRPLASEGRSDLDAARSALDRLELLPLAERAVSTLSGGERQRVLVARLLAQDAPIALLDEPTTALDVGHQQHVLDLVDELRRSHDLTVVATMHDLTLAGQYGDRLALLVGGRVAATGPAVEVLAQEVLSVHYDARVRVIPGDDGPIVVPVRDRPVR